MLTTILFGSRNLNKIREARFILNPITVLSPLDLQVTEEPKEDGKSFKQNAIIKAKFYAKKTGLPCLADDSGLVVDALDGAPGVLSARYAGSSKENIQKVLQLLQNVPKEKRSARFICIIAYYNPKTQEIQTTRGICEGFIIHKPIGSMGFGYDPIFLYTLLGKTFAELEACIKNRISHRYRALDKMKEFLAKT